MSEDVEQWWVALWTKWRVLQEYLAGPYDNKEDAKYEAIRQVQIKPEGSIVGMYSSPLDISQYRGKAI